MKSSFNLLIQLSSFQDSYKEGKKFAFSVTCTWSRWIWRDFYFFYCGC